MMARRVFCTAALLLTLLRVTVPAAEQVGAFVSVGIGGGGAMFSPACSPHDPNLMFVACDMGGVYRSEDGGRSWSMLDKRQLRFGRDFPVQFHPSDPHIVYALSGGALRVSTDRGRTFLPVVHDRPWGDARIDAFAIHRAEAVRLLIGVAGQIYCTQDGGKSWTKSAGSQGRVLKFYSPLGTRGMEAIVLVGTTEGVFRSDDSGQTWHDASHGLPWRNLRGFAGGCDERTGKIALYCTIPSQVVDGELAGGVFRSFDLANSWQSAMGRALNLDIGRQDPYGFDEIPQYQLIAMAENRPQTVYVTTRGTGSRPPHHFTVFRSDDGGLSWHSAYSRRSDTTEGAREGEAWTSSGLEVTGAWQFAFDPHDSTRAYICYTDIGFARSEDRGKTWRYSGRGSPWRNTWYGVAFDPQRRGTIYAACSNHHDIPHYKELDPGRQQQPRRRGGGVCISHDFGTSWQPLGHGLPDAPATSIVLDRHSNPTSRTLYVAVFGHGMYKSTDSGMTWHTASEGLGSAENLHAYSVKLHADGTLLCSVTGKRQGAEFADGSGLYRSVDGGGSWRPISPSLKWAGDFDFDPADSKTVYLTASTAPRFAQGGLYRTTDGGVAWTQVVKEGDLPRELHPFIHAFFVAVHPTKRNTIYLSAYTHGLFISQDSGTTWREIRGIPFTGAQRVTFDPVDEGTIWVTTHGGGVWKGPQTGIHDRHSEGPNVHSRQRPERAP